MPTIPQWTSWTAKELLESIADLDKQVLVWKARLERYARDGALLKRLQSSNDFRDQERAVTLEKRLAAEKKRSQSAIKQLRQEWEDIPERLLTCLKAIEIRAAAVKELHAAQRNALTQLVPELKAALKLAAEKRHAAILEALRSHKML